MPTSNENEKAGTPNNSSDPGPISADYRGNFGLRQVIPAWEYAHLTGTGSRPSESGAGCAFTGGRLQRDDHLEAV